MRLHRLHPSSGQSGFTLIEMMIVLLLIGITTATIIPEMKGTMEAEALNSTTRKLARGLSLAYSQSVTINQPHRLRIDTTTGKYQVEYRAIEEGRTAGFAPLRDMPGSKGELNSKIEIKVQYQEVTMDEDEEQEAPPEEMLEEENDEEQGSGMYFINFLPDGTADRKEIVLRDRAGFGIALRVNPITARVRIVKLKKE